MKPFDRISLLSKDAKILLVFNCIGTLLMTMRSVFIPIYLLLLGFSPLLIGTYLTISALASGITSTTFALLSSKYGRKKFLLINLTTSSLYYLIPLLTTDVITILASSIFSYQSRESPIVNALLADHTNDEDRTNLFTLKLFSGSIFGVLGPMISGLPIIFQKYYNFSEFTSFKPLFIIGIGLTIISFILVLKIKETFILKKNEKVSIPKEQYHIIMKLATTRAIDTLAVGITLSIFSLWFTLRYSVDIGVVSIVFTFAQVAETLAYLFAPYISRRLGNVKGTVIIRGFGAVVMLLLAFAPTPLIAAILYALRNSFQKISHPLRQSYTMGILDPKIRAAGAGLINIPRILTMSAGPSIGGYLMGISTMFPPLVSETVFAIGDILYWIFFKDLKLPEEK